MSQTGVKTQRNSLPRAIPESLQLIENKMEDFYLQWQHATINQKSNIGWSTG